MSVLFSSALTQQVIDCFFIPHDLQRLESYLLNQVEYRLIFDLTSDMSRLYFEGKLADSDIKPSQKAILLGIGLQNKTIDNLSDEFGWPAEQILSNFRDCVKKLSKRLENVLETTIEKTMIRESDLNTGKSFTPTAMSFSEELNKDAKILEKKQKAELKRLKNESFAEYAIKGTDEDWSSALGKNKSGIVSVKRYVKLIWLRANDVL